jgi:predicted kinase
MKFKQLHKIFYMPVGISGSGKSRILHSVFEEKVIIEPDQIRKELTGSVSDQSRDREVWELALARVKKSLEKEGVAVLDATNTKSSLRTQFLKELPADTHKIAIVFQPKGTDEEIVDKLHGRILGDLHAGKDRSDVPKEILQKQLKQFQNGYKNIFIQFDDIEIINI